MSRVVHRRVVARVELGLCHMQRSQLKTMHISAHAAEAVVEAHVKLYVVTYGGVHDPAGSQAKASSSPMDVDDVGG